LNAINSDKSAAAYKPTTKEKVRGIVVVGRQDQALSYAVRAAPVVRVKEFTLQIVDASVPTLKDAAAKA
jgi:hypothetical protein